MQRQSLNSPTDGNGATSGNITNRAAGANYTLSRQCLSGPDSMNSLSNSSVQRDMPRNMPQSNAAHRDCGCGNKKPANLPPASRQPMPQRQLPPASQQALQGKNYQNNIPTKYPQQNQ